MPANFPRIFTSVRAVVISFASWPLDRAWALMTVILCLASVSTAVAQQITSSSVSPNPYSASGQPLTFSIAFTSGNRTINSVNVSSGIGVTYTCSPTSGGLNTVVSCSGTYVTTPNDVTSSTSFVQEVADVSFNDGNDVPQGLGQAVIRANYLDPQPPADSEAPTVNVPTNISVPTDPGQATAVVTYATITASDNVGVASGPTLAAGLPSGAAFPVGDTTVTYEATDAAGNVGSASFTVTVFDNEAQSFDQSVI